MPSGRPRGDRQYPPHHEEDRQVCSLHRTLSAVENTAHNSQYQPTPPPHLGSAEIGRHEHGQVGTDKFVPGSRLLAGGSWRNPMTLEDITHRLVTDGIAQIGQCPHDTVVAPRAILSGHPHHEVFERLVNGGTSWSLALWGGVTLLG